jgi:hypothetical protein
MSNAANPKDVKKSEEKEKSKRERELLDLITILQLQEGRRLLWRLMSETGVFKSVWEPSAKIHYNAGQQDFGHFIMAEIVAADQDKLFLMMSEAKKKEEINNV